MNKLIITAILTFTPFPALASGSEVLSLFWIIALVFLIVSISLLLSKFGWKNTIIIFITYLAAALATFYATSGIPYLKNMLLINSANIAIPALAWLVPFIYFYMHRKHAD